MLCGRAGGKGERLNGADSRDDEEGFECERGLESEGRDADSGWSESGDDSSFVGKGYSNRGDVTSKGVPTIFDGECRVRSERLATR